MSKPRISLAMIAKDEEANIGRAIRSAASYCHQIVVVDTGSSDGTVGIARSLGAEVHSFPWNGSFADARNEALRHCTGDWVLFMDCDEELDAATAPRLVALARAAGQKVRCYSVLVRSADDRPGSGYSESYAQRFFRRDPSVHWERPIHEQLAGCDEYVPTRELVLSHTGYLREVFEGRGKAERNIAALEAMLEAKRDPFDLFNLGKELYVLGRHAEALPLFEEVIASEKPAANRAFVAYAYALAVGCCVMGGDLQHGIEIGERGARHYRYSDLYCNLGSCYLNSGNPDRAIVLYGAAISVGSSEVADGDVGASGWRSHEYMGHAYATKGEYVRAVECYLASERLAPSRPEPRIRAAVALAGLGEMALARSYLRGVLACWPDNEQARAGLAKLQEMETA